MTRSTLFKDASGTITAGATAQVAQVATTRGFLQVHNPRAETESLLVNVTGLTAASGNAVELAPGGTLTYETDPVPGNAVSVVAVTTGHKYVLWWA